MIIFHGDNLVASREALHQTITQLREKFSQVDHYLATGVNPAKLEISLGEVSLFNERPLTIVEELHSLPKSANRTALISQLQQTGEDDQVILWEKKLLTAKQLAGFPRATIKTFKASKSLFQWLDSLKPAGNTREQLRLFQLAVTQDGVEFCFLMLVRQLRLLIEFVETKTVTGPPFMQKKIRDQARNFSLAQLITLHNQLTIIDFQSKTGQSLLPVKERLDLLQIEL